jgi:hypothetical protein
MSTSNEETRTAPALVDRRAIRRAVAGVGLVGIALIHVLDLSGNLTELRYVGVMFVGVIFASLGVAEALMRCDDPRAWLAAGALAGATMFGYTLSRTVGMPGDGGRDIGNWLEPLGLASLLVEGMVVLLTVGRLADGRQT